MKLELHRISVGKLAFGAQTGVSGGVLTINKDELASLLLQDDRLSAVAVDVAHPGESVRIMPVKDAIEPRCKLEGPGEVFPGWIGDVENAGEGKTLVLGGMAVLTTGRVVAPQEGIVDMSGPGVDYTPFSRTCNVVLSFDTAEDLEPHQREACYRIAGLKAAHYLASACKDAAADSVEAYDFPPLAEAMHQYSGLPKVAYIYMLQSQGLLHDTWVYGVDAKRILPTMISPTELMDGAIISGNCVSACDKNNTYVHLNNPVIKSLYEHHGKDLNFVGVIITNENVTLADKKRSSSYAVKLARMLGVDAVVISEEGFGNPDADLIMNCRKSEQAGIKTVLITDEYAGRDGSSQSLADSCPEGDACVTAGNANEIIVLPPMDKVIGDQAPAETIAGGFFGSGESTGSVGVVTINLPRIAYLAKDEADFYQRLDKLMDISARSLKTKRTVITKLLDAGLYPYTKRYLGNFDNHFSTIGLIGMNEVGLNASWLRADLTQEKTQAFAKDVLNHMRERLSDYQEQYGDLYNLEATPAESTTYRFAKHDKAEFPGIITANENGTPYYTNSSHLPVGYTEDIFSALDVQDELQTLYTSGTVFHAFLGEKLPSWQAAAALVRKIAENYKLPYYTMSPTYSVCADHGYLSGEQYTCPICGRTTEVYSRITGYYRPVQNWNDGKTQEFKDRKVYDISASQLRRAGRAGAQVTAPAEPSGAAEGTELMLFTTRTCPNCRQAENLLQKADIPYHKVVAEESPELTTRYGVRQAPTLVLDGADQPEKITGLGPIKKFAERQRTQAAV